MALLVGCLLALAVMFAWATCRLTRTQPRVRFIDCCLPVYGSILLCRTAGMASWWGWFAVLPPLAFVYGYRVCGRLARARGYNYHFFGCLGVLGIGLIVLAILEPGGIGHLRPAPAAATVRFAGSRQELVDAPGLICLGGEYEGGIVPLDSPVVVGRDPRACNLVLRSDALSRTHLRVEVDAHGQVLVTDLGSLCGSRLRRSRSESDIRLEAFQSHVLQVGDFVSLADGAQVFRLVNCSE
ncbi:MAG: FHA domain-containing protein [bacterium]|nr:FHA domain-containing protein [bacterium]